MPVDSDSLGTYLRQQRERRQVSLQDIAAATKIQLKFLEALENDAYDQLPAAPFVVGFLRAYAQCIALDPDMILTAYRSLQPTPETGENGHAAAEVPVPVAPRRSYRRLAALMLVLALGLGLGLYEFRRERQTPSPVASLPAPLPPAKESVPKPVASSAPGAAQTAPPVAAPTPTPPPVAGSTAVPHDVAPPPAGTPVADAVQTVSTPVSPPPPQPDAGPPADKTAPLILQAKALEDTWLRVEIDGQKQRSLLLGSGKSVQWEAQERFRLTIGNARGTHLALNGRDISLPSSRSNVIRDFLLTRSSLQ